MNASTLVLRPFYRSFELPWEAEVEQTRRFRKLLTVGIVLLAVVGLLIPLLHVPQKIVADTVPQRLARVMIEEKPQPPPPPPPPPKVEPQVTKPTPQAKPIDRQQVAREKAEKSLSRVKDELADLRTMLTNEPLGKTKNLTGAVGADTKAERSLIASKVGAGSSGITSSSSSRGFGSGAGSLTGVTSTRVSSPVGAVDGKGVQRTGSSGKASRSREEIELVFDRNKGAIYALYSRALRDHPELQGKMVLEFTISPAGEVTMCRVVSSELKDPELERKIVARVKMFRFEARDVETITTTKPIDFFPA
jgi:TonB family protein